MRIKILYELVNGPAAGNYVELDASVGLFEFRYAGSRTVWQYRAGFAGKAYFVKVV